MPLGFCAYIHLRLPSLSTLASVSRKASLSFCILISCTEVLISLSPLFPLFNSCKCAFTFCFTLLNLILICSLCLCGSLIKLLLYHQLLHPALQISLQSLLQVQHHL